MKTKEILNAIRKPIRCPNCNKLLLKAKLTGTYSIQVMCGRCKNIVELSRYDKKEEK